MTYRPGAGRPVAGTNEILESVLEIKQNQTLIPQFFQDEDYVLDHPDGVYPARIGTVNADLLDGSASTGPIEYYAGDNDDTMIGGTSNDHHVPGKGDDLVTDQAGFDRYYLHPEGGHDTISDQDRHGELWYNGHPIDCTFKHFENESLRGAFCNDDFLYVFVPSTNGAYDQFGTDGLLTFDELPTNPSQSVILPTMPFPITSMGVQSDLSSIPHNCGLNGEVDTTQPSDDCVMTGTIDGDVVIRDFNYRGVDARYANYYINGERGDDTLNITAVGYTEINGGSGDDAVYCDAAGRGSFRCVIDVSKGDDRVVIPQAHGISKAIEIHNMHPGVKIDLGYSHPNIQSIDDLTITTTTATDFSMVVIPSVNGNVIIGFVPGYEVTNDDLMVYSDGYEFPESSLPEVVIGSNEQDEVTLAQDGSFAATFDDDDFITVEGMGSHLRGGKGKDRVRYVFNEAFDPDATTTTTSTTPSTLAKRQATSPRIRSDFHYDFSDEDEPIELHDYGDVIDRDQRSIKPYGFRQSLLPNSREGQI